MRLLHHICAIVGLLVKMCNIWPSQIWQLITFHQESYHETTLWLLLLSQPATLSLLIPLLLFVNLGELLLTQGPLRWEWATLDHFRARCKTTPNFSYHQGVYFSFPALSASLYLKPHPSCAADLVRVCCGLGRGSVSEWEGSHMLAVWTYSPN